MGLNLACWFTLLTGALCWLAPSWSVGLTAVPCACTKLPQARSHPVCSGRFERSTDTHQRNGRGIWESGRKKGSRRGGSRSIGHGIG